MKISNEFYQNWPIFSNFNPFPSVPSIAIGDRKQFQCLQIVFNSKSRSLVLELGCCEGTFTIHCVFKICQSARFLQIPAIRTIFKAKSINPKTYSPPSQRKTVFSHNIMAEILVQTQTNVNNGDHVNIPNQSCWIWTLVPINLHGCWPCVGKCSIASVSRSFDLSLL